MTRASDALPKVERFTTLEVIGGHIRESGFTGDVIDDLLDRLPKILESAPTGMMGHGRPVSTVSHDSLWRILETVRRSYVDKYQEDKAETIVTLKAYLESRLGH